VGDRRRGPERICCGCCSPTHLSTVSQMGIHSLHNGASFRAQGGARWATRLLHPRRPTIERAKRSVPRGENHDINTMDLPRARRPPRLWASCTWTKQPWTSPDTAASPGVSSPIPNRGTPSECVSCWTAQAHPASNRTIYQGRETDAVGHSPVTAITRNSVRLHAHSEADSGGMTGEHEQAVRTRAVGCFRTS